MRTSSRSPTSPATRRFSAQSARSAAYADSARGSTRCTHTAPRSTSARSSAPAPCARTRRARPKDAQVIAKIDSARAAGQDVATDQYPYVAGQNNLSSCIPPWAHADGKLLERLTDPATRQRIHAEMLNEHADWESLCTAATPN